MGFGVTLVEEDSIDNRLLELEFSLVDEKIKFSSKNPNKVPHNVNTNNF